MVYRQKVMNSLTPYRWVRRFFISNNFSTPFLASLVGGYFSFCIIIWQLLLPFLSRHVEGYVDASKKKSFGMAIRALSLLRFENILKVTLMAYSGWSSWVKNSIGLVEAYDLTKTITTFRSLYLECGEEGFKFGKYFFWDWNQIKNKKHFLIGYVVVLYLNSNFLLYLKTLLTLNHLDWYWAFQNLVY